MRGIAMLALVGSAAACACPPRSAASPRPATVRAPGPQYALLAPDPAAPTIELSTERGAKYRYTLQREASGVETDLRAVLFDDTEVIAAGDGGVMLARTQTGPWARQQTPTTQRLRALVAGSDGVFAVGDAGTILRRGPTGAWVLEPAPVTADLYALAETDHGVYAVGDRGTVLVRRAGAWTVIPAHTEADLRTFDGHVAVGLGGAIVDCTQWDRDQYNLARLDACVPRPSPTTADLVAGTGGGEPYVGGRVFGAGGVNLSTVQGRPVDAMLLPAIAGELAITAAVANNGSSELGSLPGVIVGRHGAVLFLVRPHHDAATTLADAVDLFGVAARSLDTFAVGAHGTIVHMQAVGLREMQVSW